MKPSAFNIWDSAQMTYMTQSAVDKILGDDRERIATQFAPVVGTQVDKIAKERLKVKAVGKGRIIADDATPPIYRPETKIVQEMYELIRISEMTPVEESLRRALENNGTDADSVERRKRAGVDIITRARALQVRNENESDYLTMYGLVHGELPISVANPPDGDTNTEYAIDYEYPSGHLAVVSTSFADTVNAVPITYMRAWQEKLRGSSGSWGINFYMSSEMWQYILTSKQVRDTMTPNVGPQYIATEEHVRSLLYEPTRVKFHIHDEGWFEESAGYDVDTDLNKTRWIPKDRILVTTEDPHRGERLAQMWDGLVPVQTGWNSYDYRGPGPQSYVQLIQGNLTLMWRNEMRRMLMINKPECLISAKAVL